MAELTRFVLTAPVRGAVFDLIEQTYADLDGFVERLKDKKIDTQHFECVRARLAGMQDAGADVRDIRAYRIYFRALLLQLLDEEAAWTPKPKKDRPQ